MTDTEQYIPALRYNVLTPVYDWVLRVLMREGIYKRRLVEYIPTEEPLSVLDAGCGTGTLTIMMKHRSLPANITGIDGDRNILQRALKKTQAEGLRINYDYGYVTQLPYANECFDYCVCSLVLHHLTKENKQKALHEFYRVLKPNGRLLIIDFSTPHNFPMMMLTLITQYFEETYDNFRGCLLEFIHKSGFIDLNVDSNFWTPFGTVSIINALKPTI